MRINLRKHHEQYLKTIASQMGIFDISEALNLLLWELRRINYSFGSSLPQLPHYQQQPQTSNYLDPSTFEAQATAMSGLNFHPSSPQRIQEFEELREEVDPIIQRLAELIDSF